MRSLPRSARPSRRRALAAAALTTAGLVIAAVLGSVATSYAETTRSVAADADAAVVRGWSWANLGGWPAIAAGSNDQLRSYVRFSQIPAGFTKAVLKLSATSGSGSVMVNRSQLAWQESTLTWDVANQFVVDFTTASGSRDASGWTSVDVTALVGRDSAASFRIMSTGTDALVFSSREAGASVAPRLELTYPDTTTTAPTTSPTTTTRATTTVATTTTRAATTTAAPTTTPPTTTAPAPTGTIAPIASNFNVNDFIVSGYPAKTQGDIGSFRGNCKLSHLAYDDAIVNPGVVGGASHLHMFFGNTKSNAYSTYESLRTTGDGTCSGGPVNRSAYWTPTVHNGSGKVLVPADVILYYKSDVVAISYPNGGFGAPARTTIENIKPFPPGLRMIAGYDMANTNAPRQWEWLCSVNQTKQAGIPDSCASSSEQILAKVIFPNCWDGRLDSADHRSHMAYAVGDANGKAACPSSHPTMLPQFTIQVVFNNDGDSRNWYVSSDRMPGMTHADGTTWHADWFGAWDPGIQQTWLDTCVKSATLDCDWGRLGDGRRLVAPPLDPYAGSAAIAPPPPLIGPPGRAS